MIAESENSTISISLDVVDLEILRLLKHNAKLGTKEISSSIGLSITATYERIRRLEKKQVITCYMTMVDKRKMGIQLSVLCNVQLKSHATQFLNEFEDAVVMLPEVINIYHIAGNYDYLLMIEIKDMNSYAEFMKTKLSAIPHISTVQSSFIMRQIKNEYE